jgi:hypothetical protein
MKTPSVVVGYSWHPLNACILSLLKKLDLSSDFTKKAKTKPTLYVIFVLRIMCSLYFYSQPVSFLPFSFVSFLFYQHI